MLIKSADDIRPSEITPPSIFHNRRRFIRNSASIATTALVGGGSLLLDSPAARALATDKDATGPKLEGIVDSVHTLDEDLTPYHDVTSYNNFYEFGTDKRDPMRYADQFTPHPWEVEVLGECEKPGKHRYEDIVKPHQLEERIYRLRCVEAWSMVVPWVGIPLRDVLPRFAPTSKAKYVAFRTILRPEQMRGQSRSTLDWPYAEGLRIDEAMHPLTLLTVGLYGTVLPNQNGAPIRLVIPWKYGFKSIKSIVAIEFTEQQPATSWNRAAPREYGFYSNVNPMVSHPRWSQARERRIGEIFKRETLMFNGYADQVAELYAGMDLSMNY